MIITINAVNDAPIAVNDTIPTTKNTVVSNTVTTNDSDVEGLDLNSFTLVDSVKNGVIVFNTNGTYTYTPNNNFVGKDSMTYQVCDSGTPKLCATATLILNVLPTNVAPIAVNDSVITNEDTPLSKTVATNDFDNDGNLDPNGFSLVDSVKNGVIIFNTNGTYTYTPKLNFNGLDSMTYQVCDLGTPKLCATATLIITVTAVNDAPIAVNDTATTVLNTPLSNTVSLNDFDVDNNLDTLSFATTSNPVNGTILMNPNGTYTYTPNPGFIGLDSVSYTVCDLGNPIYCANATLYITVEAPICSAIIAKDTLFAGGKCDNGSLKVCVDIPLNKMINYGIFIDGIPYTDSLTACTNTATSISVSSGTHTLTITDKLTGCVDSAIIRAVCVTSLKVVASVSDTKTDSMCLLTNELLGSVFTVTNICGSATNNVEFDIIPGKICFTYTGKAVGVDSTCFQVCDEYGICDTTYVTINVRPSYIKPPVASNDTSHTFRNFPVEVRIAKNDSLGGGMPTVTIISQPVNGTVTISPDNTSITYLPNKDFCSDVPDTLIYEICNGLSCSTATVFVKTSCETLHVNNAFSPNNDDINELFIIDGIENLVNNHLTIYNRWGNRVCEKNNYQNNWDGTWEGKKLPSGTYFYLLEDGIGGVYSGYLQIQY